jgi:hypothetical protein
VLGISGDGEQRLGRRAEQQVVDHRLVLVGDRGDLGRQGEDQVEVADRQQVGLAGGQPVLRRRALALRAMPVTADPMGVWMATGALTECGCSTPHSGDDDAR